MSEFFTELSNIYYNETFQVILKLVLITVLAGIIGYERENSSKPAGLRTHILVGISSVLVMICGIEIAATYGTNDPSRMPAQLLSGIGFIGAGTILSNGFKVRGLTTASGLLAITCIGLAVGSGLYIYAIIATGIVYIILRYSYLVNSNLEHLVDFKFKVFTEAPKDILEELNNLFVKYEVNISKLKIVDDDNASDSDFGYILYECKVLNTTFNKNQFITELAKINKVKQIKEI